MGSRSRRPAVGPAGSSLWPQELGFLLLEHVQILGFLAVVAARSAAWPPVWAHVAHVAVLANMDVWGLARQWPHGSPRRNPVPSADMHIAYAPYLGGWVVGVALLAGGLAYRWRHLRTAVATDPIFAPALLRWETRSVFALHALVLPLGLVAARVAHCAVGVVEVDNARACGSNAHAALLAAAVVSFTLLVGAWVALLVRTVRRSTLGADSVRHAAYMALLERAHASGEDLSWTICHASLHGAFRRPWVHARALSAVFKSALVAFFAACYRPSDTPTLTLVVLVLLGTAAGWSLVASPYASPPFSWALRLSLVSNTALAFLLYVSAQRIRSPWVMEPIHTRVLAAATVIPLVALLGWALWLLIALRRSRGVARAGKRLAPLPAQGDVLRSAEPRRRRLAGRNNQVHPLVSVPLSDGSGSEDTDDDNDHENPGDLAGMVERGHRLLRQYWAGSALLAPVPALARHIVAVDRAWREADACGDPAAFTLCVLLDELVAAHNSAVPHALRAGAMDRATTRDLTALAPALARRLRQRAFDLALVEPRRRRLLLRLLCVAAFLPRKRVL